MATVSTTEAPFNPRPRASTKDEPLYEVVCARSCVQIAVNAATRAGINNIHIQAILAGNLSCLSAEMRDVYKFTKAVVQATGEEDALREALRSRYGEEGLVELALAIAVARTFPTTERALGYANSCSRVKVLVPGG